MPPILPAGHRLALLLVLVPAVAAQTPLAPSDSVRVERLLDGMELDRQIAASLARMGGAMATAAAPERVSLDAVRRAVHARLAEGYSPARADALETAIADGRYGAFVDHVLSMEAPESMARLVDVMMTTPKKGALGDSLAAVRFVHASGLVEYARETLRAVFANALSRVPSLANDLAEEGGTVEDVVENQVAEIEPAFVLIVRTAPPDERVRPTTTAFVASDAGRYASGAVFGGMRDVFVPAITESMIGQMDLLETDDSLDLGDEAPMYVKPKPFPGE